MTRYFVLAFLVLVFLSPNTEAATLFGRVIEVNDGDVITVFNLNRPVRIKLMAIDAPEAGQPFGDVARKHLSDLVYDKNVLVEYWGIAADSSLVGRVTVNNVDVGVQMIRDGAAWFDTSNQERLTAADREIYQQSEQAARSERRGLWQGENPIAPWEFVRAQTLRRNPAASLNTIFPAAWGRRDELNTMMLMGAPPARSKNSTGARWVPGERHNWRQFKPATENFSVLMPEGGEQPPVRFMGPGSKFNIYVAGDGWAAYALMWVTSPSRGESDESAFDGVVQEFIQEFGDSNKNGQKRASHCELEGVRRFSLNGFNGIEYSLPSCGIPARIMAYTRVTRGIRKMYIGTAYYFQDEPNITRFLNSFTVTSARPKAKRR